MKMNKHKKQLIKIYGSFLLCPIWFLAIYVLSRLFPGTFQEQRPIEIWFIYLMLGSILDGVNFTRSKRLNNSSIK